LIDFKIIKIKNILIIHSFQLIIINKKYKYYHTALDARLSMLFFLVQIQFVLSVKMVQIKYMKKILTLRRKNANEKYVPITVPYLCPIG